MANGWGNNGNSDRLSFLIFQNHCRGWLSHEIKRHLLLGRKAMTNLDSMLKKQRPYFANKGPSGQNYGFSSSHLSMWELDYKESCVLKNWCFWTLVLKTLESPLQCKEIQPIHHKRNQSWIFIGRTDAEAETPILWPLDAKELTHWKRPWCWERLKAGEEGDDRGWNGWTASLTQWTWILSTPGVDDVQGSMACYSSWSCKESDTTQQLN